MSYLYLMKYIYKITNNFDLQILIHDIIKTKQLKNKLNKEIIELYSEMDYYYGYDDDDDFYQRVLWFIEEIRLY
jgi:hypothetical protein